MGMRPEVQIAIDSLVLPGFTRREAERASAALSQELQRLVSELGLPPGLRLDAAANYRLEIRGGFGGLRPEAAGVMAARALYAKWG